MIKPTQAQLDAAFSAMRAYADNGPYGSFISDNTVRDVAQIVASAVVNVPQPAKIVPASGANVVPLK